MGLPCASRNVDALEGWMAHDAHRTQQLSDTMGLFMRNTQAEPQDKAAFFFSPPHTSQLPTPSSLHCKHNLQIAEARCKCYQKRSKHGIPVCRGAYYLK